MKRKNALSFLLLTGLIFIGCTKEQPYESLYKEHLHDKSVVNENAEFIYLPSAVEADRQAPGGRPFWVGERKLVHFAWTETELQIIEIDPDGRWKDNPTNGKLVLSIPVKHLGYRCAKDKYGECTNKEEEVGDVPFSQKPSFKPDMGAAAIREVDLMPIELENLFTGGACYSETGKPELIGYNLNEDGLNLQLERTYQASPFCVAINEWEDFANLSFKARFNYSVVKLDKLKTQGYEPISYPKTDEGTFGFFTTEKRKLGPDNQDLVTGAEVLMNRWNPKRGEIVYNLSPSFAKPENASILNSTQKVVEKLNRGLTAAHSGLQIKLAMPEGRISGDLHHSEIVLIEDPMKVGLLGYGPSITDPKTGEILWARVAMYSGVMKQFIWREYNALVKEKKETVAKSLGGPLVDLSDELKAKAQPINGGGDSSSPALDIAGLLSRTQDHPGFKFSKLHTDISGAKLVHGLIAKAPTGKTFLVSELRKEMRKLNKDDMTAKMLEYIRHPSSGTLKDSDSASVREKIAALDQTSAIALTGAFPAELFNFQAAISAGQIEDIVGTDPRYWEELSDDERNAIIEKVLPIVWEATLIHEIGHTLGLRHNFAGSEDATNFYSHDELENMGVDKPVPYSSVMEYPYSDISALNTLGKYDIAALRYGYAREVETADGSIKNIGTQTLKDTELAGVTLKSYSYCTDEHADANPNCNRFDEGTNYSEISKQLVSSAEHFYGIRNFRNGRRLFSLYTDRNYIAGVDDRMFGFRLFFERFSSIQTKFKIPMDIWKGVSCAAPYTPDDCAFLKGIYDGVQTGLTYMLDTLTTPDTICAIATTAAPTKIIALANLTDISDDAMDCFDAKINPVYTIIGQTGKSFKSRKATTNENSYADQIDVRGIWGDKIVALDYLLNRRLGSSLFDDDITAFLDNEDLGPQVLSVLADILLDNVTRTLEVEVPATGQKIPIQWSYSLAATHVIPEPLDSSLAKVLGLKNGMTPFIYQVGHAISSQVPHPAMPVQSQKIVESFSVAVCTSNCPAKDTGDIKVEKVGSTKYVTNADMLIAGKLIDQVREFRMYSVLTEAQVNKIYLLLNTPGADLSTLTPEEKSIYDLGLEKLVAFAQGEMKDENTLGITLEALPKMNF